MSWGSIRGHDEVVELLRRAMAEGRFPHAWLFAGPEGVGKRAIALKLARALLCERRDPGDLDPCEECPSCILARAGNHPDLHEAARPEDRHELTIAVVRDLIEALALKPSRGVRKVAIVDDADDLNDEAANAFLKTLEEPPEGTVLILLGTSPELQLDTIVSRCRVVRFGPLGAADLSDLLLEQGIAATSEEAAALASRADGSLVRARGLSDGDFDRFRRELIDAIADPRGFDPPTIARKLDAFLKEAGKESLAQRLRGSLLFGELARFFRAVLWQNAGLEPPSSDPADRVASERLASRLEPEDVFLLADRCLLADYQIDRKAYLPVLLDAFLADLHRVVSR